MWENPNVQYVGDTNAIAQRRSLENCELLHSIYTYTIDRELTLIISSQC